VCEAAAAGELNRSSFYRVKERDPVFSEAWDDCEASFMDGVEAESLKRAIRGVDEDKPYTALDGKGGKVTAFRTVTTKSDRLLELTLKARHPLYKPVKAFEHTSPDGSMTPTIEEAPDYSALSDGELQELTRLQRKARGVTSAGV